MKKQLKILYQIPSLETIYAAKFIYEGYKDAFQDLGYQFKPLTSNDDSKELLKKHKPDILISSLTHYNHKFLDLDAVKEHRKKGLVFFAFVSFISLS